MNVKPWDIRKGDRLAVTMKTGERLAVTATAKVRNTQGVNQELPAKGLIDGRHLGALDFADITDITSL